MILTESPPVFHSAGGVKAMQTQMVPAGVESKQFDMLNGSWPPAQLGQYLGAAGT